MKVRAFKPAALALLALLTIRNTGFAQDVAVNVSTSTDVTVKNNFDDRDFQISMTNIGKSIQAGVRDIAKNVSFSISGIVPKISVNLNQLGDDLNVDINLNLVLVPGVNGNFAVLIAQFYPVVAVKRVSFTVVFYF